MSKEGTGKKERGGEEKMIGGEGRGSGGEKDRAGVKERGKKGYGRMEEEERRLGVGKEGMGRKERK